MVAKKIFRLICMAVVAFTLGACAPTFQLPLDKAAYKDVKTVGLLPPAWDDEYRLVDQEDAAIALIGAPFGLAGAMVGVAAARIASEAAPFKTTQFTELMRMRNFKIVDEMQNGLNVELQNAGYLMKKINHPREVFNFLQDYEYQSLDRDVDAYLDWRVTAGYVLPFRGDYYFPVITCGVRLVEKNTGKIIYKNTIVYGIERSDLDLVTIAGDKKYFFNDRDEIRKDPDKALEGLRMGISPIIRHVVQDVSK